MSNLYTFLEEHVFPKLSERQVRCAMLRQKDIFGLGENAMTYRAIAAQERCSPERIRQILFRVKHIIANRLHQIGEAQKSPHVIIKKVTEEGLTPNLPMRQKFIYDLGELPARALNCLYSEDLLLVDKLIEQTEKQLLEIPNFGKKSLREIKELLAHHNLQLKNSRL